MAEIKAKCDKCGEDIKILFINKFRCADCKHKEERDEE